jgi:hypothetical protein
VLLVASGLLAGLERPALLAVLALSYVVWAVGLRANLRANWTLLERTGTSTDVLSKAAYEMARLTTGSVRTRRIAAATGYVGTELLKEVPYYAGAFGAALLSESVSSNEALVFLAGANLGAAAYEYGLACLTRAFLESRSRRHEAVRAEEGTPAYASFEDDWVPADYLSDYYRVVEPDERATIAYFVEAVRDVTPGEPILVFGVGPTLHHVFLTAGKASEIHLAEYLPANRRELERWLDRDPGAHDWSPFVRYTLACEGNSSPTDEQVAEREERTRARITKLLPADARQTEPLGPNAGRYATVISAYCADSATDDRAVWETYMRHITSLVRPGGTFVTAALRRSRVYLVGGRPFPSANVDEDDLGAVLAPEFELGAGSIEARAVPEHESLGYSGIVLARARKRTSC